MSKVLKVDFLKKCVFFSITFFNLLKLSLSPINKEPVRKLNKKTNVTNISISFVKKTNCSKFMKLLNISEAGFLSTNEELQLYTSFTQGNLEKNVKNTNTKDKEKNYKSNYFKKKNVINIIQNQQ